MKGHLKLNNMNTSKNVPGGIFQPQTLEVDERIFDKNLRIVEESIGEVSGNPFLNKNVVKESNPLRPEPVLPTISGIILIYLAPSLFHRKWSMVPKIRIKIRDQ